MNKARTSYPISIAGGVLSLAGLCLGILSLDKKRERRTDPSRSVEPQGEQVQTLAKTPDHLERQNDSPDKSVMEELTPADSNREPRPSREMIADMARKGESTLAIAQALGISVGEVQLTLKLQQFAVSAARRP